MNGARPPGSRIPQFVLALALAWAGAALAEEGDVQRYQVHGFLSQGYTNSDGNDFFGHSRGGGSFEYYELGLNGIWEINDSLSAAAQLYARDAGRTADGDPRIDYAFLDWRFLNRDTASAGVRAGRVKNPMGFYNEYRDAIFTRPSILLAESIYVEGQGVRDLLFSSDGIQLYAGRTDAAGHTEVKVNVGMSADITGTSRANLLANVVLPPPITVDDLRNELPVFTQLVHETHGGTRRYAISYTDLTLGLTFNPPGSLPDFESRYRQLTLSAQRNFERLSLTSEYAITHNEQSGAGFPSAVVWQEGLYAQGQYHFTPAWRGLLRYDLYWFDRNDRGNSESHDATIGLSWLPDTRWILSGEYHHIGGSDGTAGIPLPDNPAGPIRNHTRLLVLMLGYRF